MTIPIIAPADNPRAADETALPCCPKKTTENHCQIFWRALCVLVCVCFVRQHMPDAIKSPHATVEATDVKSTET